MANSVFKTKPQVSNAKKATKKPKKLSLKEQKILEEKALQAKMLAREKAVAARISDDVLLEEATRREEVRMQLIRNISDSTLFSEAKARKRILIRRRGPYATMKKFRRCRGCKVLFSTRDLRSHECPSGLSWKKRYPRETRTAAA